MANAVCWRWTTELGLKKWTNVVVIVKELLNHSSDVIQWIFTSILYGKQWDLECSKHQTVQSRF